MRVLVLSRDARIGRIVQTALGSEFSVVVAEPLADISPTEFDVVLADDWRLLERTAAESAAAESTESPAAVLVQTQPAPFDEGGSSRSAEAAAGMTSAAALAVPTVAISGSEPPSEGDAAALRRIVLQRERIRTAQKLARLERRAASATARLQALQQHTQAQLFTVDLLPRQGSAATDAWLLETVGGKWRDPKASVHPADLSRLRAAVADYLSGASQAFEVEFRLLGASGQWEWVRQRATVGASYSDDGPQQVFVTQTVHTGLYRAESLLERQSTIIEQLVSGDSLEKVLVSLIVAIEDNYAGALAVVARLDQPTGRLYNLAGPSLPQEYHDVFEGLAIGPGVGACGAAAFEGRRVVIADLLEDASCQPYQAHFKRFGVRSIWSQPIFGSDGDVLGTFAIYHREPHSPDAEEVRLIETAANLAGLAIERWKQIDSLLQNEKRFLQLANLARLFPWDYDVPQRRFTYIGPQVQTILGYTPAALSTAEFWKTVVHPDDLEELTRRVEHSERYGESFAFEYRVLARDGRVVWLHGLFSVVLKGGKGVRLQGFSLNITARKLAEAALRESEERYRILADYSSDMIARLDSSGQFLYASPASRTLLGYDPNELIGRNAFELIHEEDLPTVLEQWKSLDIKRNALETYRIRRADGEYIWFETRGQHRPTPDGQGFEAIVISRDVSEQVEASRKLRERELDLAHAERLATMGQMAAELAHELNQPLQAISNFAEAAMHWVDHPTDNLDPLRRWTGQIAQQARRAGEVVRRIRNFVRKGELDPDAFDLTACVRGLQPLLDVAARGHRAKVEYQLAENLPELVADRLLIEQVVVNLFRNALEAMADQPAERRIVTVQTLQTDEGQVGLAVKDLGGGWDPRDEERLFEPYFTTKSGGTGMGLAICHSTIDAHQGQIWAERNAEGGATFRFLLPTHPPFSAQFLRK